MRLFFLFIISLFVLNASAQECLIQGTVVDLYTKKPLKGAEVELIRKGEFNKEPGIEFFYRKVFTVTGIPIFGIDSNCIVIKRTYTDENGHFSINRIDSPYYLVVHYEVRNSMGYNVYHDMEDVDLDSITIAKNVSKGLYLLRAICPFNETARLNHCPKCQKNDMIQNVLWGNRILDINGNILNDKGDSIPDKDLDKYYFAGCEINWCRASKNCKRCNLRF